MRKTEKNCIAVIDDEVQMLKVIGRYVTTTLPNGKTETKEYDR